MQKQTETCVPQLLKQKVGKECTSTENEGKLHPIGLFLMKLIGATQDVNVVWHCQCVSGIHVHASTDAFWKIRRSAKEEILRFVSYTGQPCSLVSKLSLKLRCKKQRK
ncbi:hypothetical protein EUGRSUZ_A00797 [Eucalyptus grandis]|uniref:Uncharacterized protein n=2 Tax=Eucalyptus grandis TaxID=71139 RepID=A0ACC3M257_EUCGR|nr:hypothetical protein EUGRSUZ_A00797 [Eucalyptus grandis]